MTQQQTLIVLEEQKTKISKMVWDLEEQKRIEFHQEVKEKLEGIIEEGDEVVGGVEYVEIKRFNKEYEGFKELMSIRWESRWDFENDEDGEVKMKLNYYTTWCDNDFEFARLVTLGKVAEEVKKNEEEWISMRVESKKKFKVSLTQLNQDKWKVEREIRELKAEMRAQEQQEFFDKMKGEGVRFVDEVSFEKRNNEVYGRIIEMQIISISKSGKRMEIKLTQRHNVWNYKEQIYEEVIQANVIDVLTSKLMDQLGWLMDKKN